MGRLVMKISGIPDADTVLPTDNVAFLDDVPEQGNPAPVGDFFCQVCNTPLTYSGRGRHPKFCDEHKPGRGSSTTSTRKSSAGTVALIDRAITEIASAYSLAAQGLKFFGQDHAGTIVYDKREYLAESYRPLLEVNKKVRDLFAKTEKAVAILPIIVAHAEITAAIMFDRMAEDFMKENNQQPSPNGRVDIDASTDGGYL